MRTTNARRFALDRTVLAGLQCATRPPLAFAAQHHSPFILRPSAFVLFRDSSLARDAERQRNSWEFREGGRLLRGTA